MRIDSLKLFSGDRKKRQRDFVVFPVKIGQKIDIFSTVGENFSYRFLEKNKDYSL